MIYRSKPYLKWIITQPSDAPPKWWQEQVGDKVYAHLRIAGGNGGTGIKPHDTFAACLYDGQHKREHSGPKTFWGGVDLHKLIANHIIKYLDEKHNINGWQLVATLLTEYMDREGMK